MEITQRNIYYTWKEFEEDYKLIVRYIKTNVPHIKGIYAIPKGGLVLGVKLANEFDVPLYLGPQVLLKLAIWWNKIRGRKNKFIIIDDISDTGKTLIKIPDITEITTITLFIKKGTRFMPSFHCREAERNQWVVFTGWEPK